MAKLILVRHGTSEWNALGLWQGWTDIPLAPKGKEDALRAAESLRGIKIDRAYTSVLKRAKDTWGIMKDALGISPPTVEHQALNERHYGIYQGKNKWEVKEQVGEEEFQKIRRQAADISATLRKDQATTRSMDSMKPTSRTYCIL